MHEIKFSGQFKREYRLMQKRGYDMNLLLEVIELLKRDIPLDENYKDYPLFGKYTGKRECHIRPDWLLIYRRSECYIELRRTGSHSDLFCEDGWILKYQIKDEYLVLRRTGTHSDLL